MLASVSVLFDLPVWHHGSKRTHHESAASDGVLLAFEPNRCEAGRRGFERAWASIGVQDGAQPILGRGRCIERSAWQRAGRPRPERFRYLTNLEREQ